MSQDNSDVGIMPTKTEKNEKTLRTLADILSGRKSYTQDSSNKEASPKTTRQKLLSSSIQAKQNPNITS